MELSPLPRILSNLLTLLSSPSFSPYLSLTELGADELVETKKGSDFRMPYLHTLCFLTISVFSHETSDPGFELG
ncbi:hypothetical protein GGQ19_002695 [Salinibacter ruber]|jgi:hypothetical protein|nr:hypothetical protein [Salinibacter ruber]